MYSYALGDPINFFDPTGRIFQEIGNAADNLWMHYEEAFKSDSVIEGYKILVGASISLYSGDLFDSQTEIDPGSTAMSSNGIMTNEPGRIEIRDDVNSALGITNTNAIVNDSHFFGLGDLVQIAGEELGFYTTPQLRAKRALEEMANNTTGKIDIIAHSQGTSVMGGALELSSSEIRSRVDFQGFGGQRFIDGNQLGLNSARNTKMPDDFVPELSPRNLQAWSSSDSGMPFIYNDLSRILTGSSISGNKNHYEVAPSNGLTGIDAHLWGNGYNNMINNYSPSNFNPTGKNDNCSN